MTLGDMHRCVVLRRMQAEGWFFIAYFVHAAYVVNSGCTCYTQLMVKSTAAKNKKRSQRRRAKKLWIIVIAVIIVIGAAGGYWYWNTVHQENRQAAADQEVVKTIETSTYLQGVDDSGSVKDYLTNIELNNPDAGLQAIKRDSGAAKNDKARDKVLNDYYQAASVAHQDDHIRYIVERQLEYRSGFEMYMKAAQAYGFIDDSAKQIEYLKKAQALLGSDAKSAKKDIQASIDKIEKERR